MPSVLNSITPVSANFNVSHTNNYAPAHTFDASTSWQKPAGFAPQLPQRAVPKPVYGIKGALGILPSIFQFNMNGGSK